jgi:hypothetical protein
MAQGDAQAPERQVTTSPVLEHRHDGSGRAADRLVVKFRDAARVRLDGTHFVSRAGRDLSALEQALARHGDPERARLMGRNPDRIEATRQRAEARSGRSLPDLNSYFELVVAPAERERLMEVLAGLEVVETAYRAPLPVPPPEDIPPETPDWEEDIVHLDPAPEGIDSEYAWTRPGGAGQDVFVVDIEYSWRETHEDLENTIGATECFTPTTWYIEHGTAVMGELFAGRNGYGVTGMVHEATPGFVTDYPVDMSYSVARAVDCATSLMEPGDVMLIEAQAYGPRDLDGDGTNEYVPVEWNQAEYDSISVATAAGITVIEPAGNGGEDLDDPVFMGLFDRSVRDSGAIIVGAGVSPLDWFYTDRSRLSFSTYGSRVDIQGWGNLVFTTGYGYFFDGGGDPNQYYDDAFSGTSSASPMGTAAAASLQGVQEACGGPPLDPLAVREILVDTGSPQQDGVYTGHIGPRPDLRAALERVEVDNDADGYAECEGDCDDAASETYPGAPEVNDGLDNQCPGDAGYGIVDETSGDSGFHDPADKAAYCWDPQEGATEYEVRRSDRPWMPSPCAGTTTADTCWSDAEEPTPGSAFYYLNRPTAPSVGSWGYDSAGAERQNVCS